MLQFFYLWLSLHAEKKACGTAQDDCSEFALCANTGPGIAVHVSKDILEMWLLQISVLMIGYYKETL